jgi:hypothetical protein
MAIGNTVRVEHGYEDENKILTEEVSSVIILIQKKFDNTVHGIA